MRAVIYARFSSDNQRQESITAQVRACTEYAQRNGYTVVKVYTDEAKSATTDDRPGFLEMIEDTKTGRVKVNVVLVHKLDRFARSRYDSAVYRKILAGRDVRLIAADQPLDDSPNQRAGSVSNKTYFLHVSGRVSLQSNPGRTQKERFCDQARSPLWKKLYL
jgi:site-specific DNA recombinase